MRDARDGHRLLAQAETARPNAVKHVLVDCEANTCRELVVRHIGDIYMGRRNFHYLFSNLVSCQRRRQQAVAGSCAGQPGQTRVPSLGQTLDEP